MNDQETSTEMKDLVSCSPHVLLQLIFTVLRVCHNGVDRPALHHAEVVLHLAENFMVHQNRLICFLWLARCFTALLISISLLMLTPPRYWRRGEFFYFFSG